MTNNPAPGFISHPTHTVDLVNDHYTRKVSAMGQQIAVTSDAVTVLEGKYPPVLYIPRNDIDNAIVTPTKTQTYCPFKGTASYWALTINDKTIDDAAWSYEDPYDECLPLKGHLAFYVDRVELTVETF